mgnify:FL=1
MLGRAKMLKTSPPKYITNPIKLPSEIKSGKNESAKNLKVKKSLSERLIILFIGYFGRRF